MTGRLAKLEAVWILIKDTFLGWHHDDASQLAAALAFYAVLSFAPTVVIVIAISGLVFGKEAVEGELVLHTQEWIGEVAAEFLQTVIASANRLGSGVIATIVSLVTILFGATRLFAQIQAALNKIWGVRLMPGRGVKGIVRDRFLSFLMVLGFGFFVLCFLLVTTVLTALSNLLSELLSISTYLHVINFIVSFAVMTLLFAAIYKVLPDVKIAWQDVWIGSAVTSLLFTIGKLLIGLYIGLGGIGSTYGAAASLFVLLIWIYYSAQVFLLGAEFTEVYTEKYGSTIVPHKNATRVQRRITTGGLSEVEGENDRTINSAESR